MKKSIIGLSAIALSIFALASCGGSNSSASTSSAQASASVTTPASTSTSTAAASTSTSTSAAAASTATPSTAASTATSTVVSTATSDGPKTYNFTCNLISGVVGNAKVTDNGGEQYNYISEETFKLYPYSDGITFEYTNSNTYNVKAIASVNGVLKASGVMGDSTSKNSVVFSLPASDITGDVTVSFEQTTEEPVYCIAPKKDNSNLSYAYKLTGTSKEDKTFDSEFQLEEGYENLVVTVTNNSASYSYEIVVYADGNRVGTLDELAPSAVQEITIPFSSIKNDLVIEYSSLA